MAIAKYALLALALPVLGHMVPVHAAGEDDLKVARIRQDSPDSGFLFFDITIVTNGKPSCTAESATLISDTKKLALAHFEVYRPNPLFSWTAFSRGSMTPLQPGTWTVTDVLCGSQNRRFSLRGKVAQLHIERGEIVNGGNLILDLAVLKKGTFFSRPVVAEQSREGELSADTVTALRSRAPQTFAKAKRRSFAILRP